MAVFPADQTDINLLANKQIRLISYRTGATGPVHQPPREKLSTTPTPLSSAKSQARGMRQALRRSGAVSQAA